MKHYLQLTLLASSLLCLGLQAAVIDVDPSGRYQVTESVSNVVYKSQQTVAALAQPSTPVPTKSKEEPVVEPLAESLVKAETETPAVAVVAPVSVPPKKALAVPVIFTLPLKITPTLTLAPVAKTAVGTLDIVNQPMKQILPLAAVVRSNKNVMPTTIPVHPVLNTSALVTPPRTEVIEEPSLFSAISDWFSVKPVKPWQKGTLAKKAMKPGGEVPEFDVFSEKVFAYKQGSIGGNGVGGGGCGCN